MKNSHRLSFVAICLLITTFANSQTLSPLYQHLPPSANHIYSVRLGQIITKGELAGLLNSIPPPKSPDEAGAFTIIKNPAAAGIDLNHEILIAQMTAGSPGPDTVSYIQILLPLTDSAKLRTTLATLFKEAHIRRVPGKGTTIHKDKVGMAWNDQLLVITIASSNAPISDSASISLSDKRPAAPAHKPGPAGPRSLDELALEKSLAALAGFSGAPFLTDQRFLSGFATDADMHAWSPRMDMMGSLSKFITKMAAKNPAMKGKPMPDYSSLSKMPHPPALSTFNFENGRIIFKATMFYAPEDAALYQREFDRPFNKELLARIPNNGALLGIAAMHINPAALPEAMDKYGTRQMLDSILGKKGLSINDISAAFGGDFLIAALGDTTATTDTTKKKVNVYFVATLGDPSRIMQLASKLVANNGAASMDTAMMAKMKKLTEKMVVQDNILVISSTREMAQQYFANHDRRSTELLGDNGAVQRFAIDLKAVSSFASHSMSDNPKAMVVARILEKLEKIEFTNGLMDGNNMSMTFQIVTGDPSTNSLKTLLSLLH